MENKLYANIVNMVVQIAIAKRRPTAKELLQLNAWRKEARFEIADIADANDCKANTWVDLITEFAKLHDAGERIPIFNNYNLLLDIGIFYGTVSTKGNQIIINNGCENFYYNDTAEDIIKALVEWLPTLEQDNDTDWSQEIKYIKLLQNKKEENTMPKDLKDLLKQLEHISSCGEIRSYYELNGSDIYKDYPYNKESSLVHNLMCCTEEVASALLKEHVEFAEQIIETFAEDVLDHLGKKCNVVIDTSKSREVTSKSGRKYLLCEVEPEFIISIDMENNHLMTGWCGELEGEDEDNERYFAGYEKVNGYITYGWKKNDNGDEYYISPKTGYVYMYYDLKGRGERKNTDMIAFMLEYQSEKVMLETEDIDCTKETEEPIPTKCIGFGYLSNINDIHECMEQFVSQYEERINHKEDAVVWLNAKLEVDKEYLSSDEVDNLKETIKWVKEV